ncbi:bromodomain-containing protein 4-like isoform X1 [Pseudophryne corroboree]|uniref:bromodomain-containing protein 4-like isoform X1 n=1 Tax=Pseudophryne corroboree TaxID=495146 RepID=UPI0030816C8A
MNVLPRLHGHTGGSRDVTSGSAGASSDAGRDARVAWPEENERGESCKGVSEKSSTTRRPVNPNTSDDDDAAEAGPSKEVWSSRSGSSVRHHHKKPVAEKKARSSAPPQTQQATPPRRLSSVCSVPPLQILDTPPRRHPHSPHLDSSSTGNSIPPQQHQHSDMEETNILEMQPLMQGMSPPAPVSTPPQQSTPPPPQHSPTTPGTQGPDQVFWTIWARQQATNEDSLRKQTEMFASLPSHLRRISRNLSRQNEQTTRIGNTMELMRTDITQVMGNLPHIMEEQHRLMEEQHKLMEEQHRQQQSYMSIFQNSQKINESLFRIVDNQNAATRELNATLTNLNETLRCMHQQQTTSSSGMTTPYITPVSSPPRRSTRARQHDSAKGKGQHKQPLKKT